MTRTPYGLSGGDLAVQRGTDPDSSTGGVLDKNTTVVYEVMTDRLAGSQLTDLQTLAGATISGGLVSPDSDGRIDFLGPDPYTATLWLRDQAAPSGKRWRIDPANVADRLAVLEGGTVGDHGTLTGLGDDDHTQYHNDTRGDARYYTKTQSDAAEVRLTGNQTIAGTKTFSSAPSVPDSSFTIAKTTGLQTAIDAKPDTFDELADVSATSPVDGAIPQFDTADNLWHAVDASSQFATVDATGRLAAADYPQGFVRQQVINPGGSLASYMQAGDLVYVRDTATASLDLVNAGTANNASTSASTLNVQNTATTYAVGDYAIACVVISAEATFPTAFTMTGPAGIGSMTLAPAQPAVQGSTAATLIFYGRATGSVGSSQTFTFTDTGGTASRSDIAIRLLKATGLTTSSVVDQSIAGGGASQATMNIGPTTTTVANQIAVACFGYNTTTAGTFAPASGWTQIGTPVSSTDAAPRGVAVVWRLLSAAGPVTATGTVTTGITWAGSLTTFKGA